MSIIIDGCLVHESVTSERVIDGTRRTTFGLEDVGFCICCGEEQGGCEPDARQYFCESCDTPSVYGAEELLFYFEA